MPQIQILPQYEDDRYEMFRGAGRSVGNQLEQQSKRDAVQRILAAHQESADPVQNMMAAYQNSQGLPMEQTRQMVGDIDQARQLGTQRKREQEEYTYKQQQRQKASERESAYAQEYSNLTGNHPGLYKAMGYADATKAVLEEIKNKAKAVGDPSSLGIINDAVAKNWDEGKVLDEAIKAKNNGSLTKAGEKAVLDWLGESKDIKAKQHSAEGADKKLDLEIGKEVKDEVKDIRELGSKSPGMINDIDRQLELLASGEVAASSPMNLIAGFMDDENPLKNLFLSKKAIQFNMLSKSQIQSLTRTFGYNFTDRDLAVVQKIIAGSDKPEEVNYAILQYMRSNQLINKRKGEIYNEKMKGRQFADPILLRSVDEQLLDEGYAKKASNVAEYNVKTKNPKGKQIAVAVVSPNGEIAYLPPGKAKKALNNKLFKKYKPEAL